MIKEAGGHAVFTPARGNKDSFYQKNCDKDIDISFIGRMYPDKDYGYRYYVLKKLVKDYPNLKIYIGGECAPIRRPFKFLEWILCKRYKECFVNRNLLTSECKDIYNRSKICLNIERKNTGQCWSGRIVNILLTETFVLSKLDNNVTSDYFEGGIVGFRNYNHLKQLINYYLEHEKERKITAQKGLIIAQRMFNHPESFYNIDDFVSQLEKKINRGDYIEYTSQKLHMENSTTI